MKSMNLQMKWDERKSNFLTPKKEEDGMLSMIKKQTEDMEKTVNLNRIESKLKAGNRLSQKEKDYLKKHCPDLHEKAEKIEREREEYRKALERCRTKEEADEVHMMKMQQQLAMAKSIANNPNIPKEKKLEKLTEIAMFTAAFSDEYIDFIKSDKYRDMPSEYDIEFEPEENVESEEDGLRENADQKKTDSNDQARETDSSGEGNTPYNITIDSLGINKEIPPLPGAKAFSSDNPIPSGKSGPEAKPAVSKITYVAKPVVASRAEAATPATGYTYDSTGRASTYSASYDMSEDSGKRGYRA